MHQGLIGWGNLPSRRPATGAARGTSPPIAVRRDPAIGQRPAGIGQHPAAIGQFPTDAGLAAMRTAYRATGGVACGDDLTRLASVYPHLEVAYLARRVAAGEVFGFDWRHSLWIPMFQFDLRDLSIRTGPRRVTDVLAPALDGWTMAAWFIRANVRLNERRPVDRLDSDLEAVLDAATRDLRTRA
jgi:hypothetical protein